MRPIWRHTLGVATVAIVAATAAAPTSAFGQDSGAAPRPIVGSSLPKRRTAPPRPSPSSPATSPRHRGGHRLAGRHRAPARGRLGAVRRDPRVGKDVYVYPADAADALSSGKVDEELFNVTGLVAMGYDDASTETVPVIARYTTDLGRARSAPVTPKSAAKGQTLLSIDGIALKADKAKAADFFADATDPSTAAGARSRRSGSTARPTPASISRPSR